MTDFRALCEELNGLLEYISDISPHLCEEEISNLTNSARAALAQPEPQGPTDEELLELMPETMRDEFAAVSGVYSTATGGQVKPGLFRVVLNTVALEYARAVLARWGRPVIEPVPVAERLPGAEDCDAEGHIWLWNGHWSRLKAEAASLESWAGTHWLPHHALPVPQQEAE